MDGAALSPVPKGTPEEPFVAPPPAGAPASRLQGVEVVERGGETLVRIKGDGEFAYQSFQLEDPPRFVVDLDGAVKTETDSSLAVGSGEVERIRMAQYKSEPDPVARVVFDLRSDSQPWIGRDPQGLLVRFDNGSLPTAASGRAPPPSRSPSRARAAVATDRREPVAVEPRTEVARAQLAGETSLGSQMLAARVIELEQEEPAPAVEPAGAPIADRRRSRARAGDPDRGGVQPSPSARLASPSRSRPRPPPRDPTVAPPPPRRSRSVRS